jgi:pimeloyl-ACP methyl ester carboxylesterase
LDHLFRKKLYFYQPYFFDSKYYRRRKPLNPKFKKINYTAHEIYKYGDHFLNDSRKRLFREKRLLDVVLPDFTRHQGVSFDAVPYQYIASGHHDVVEQEEVTMLLCPLGVGVGVWESLADTLRKKTKVVILDNPLLLTEQPGAEAMLAAYVANARTVLKLENAKRARLIAFDSSLVQALALARAFPQLVSRIVAISPFIPQLNRERDELCPREEKLRELIEEYRRFDAKPGEYFELVAEAIADNFALRKIEHKLPAFSSYMAQIPRKHRSLFVAPFLNSTTLRNFELWMRAPGVFGAAEAFDGVTVPGTVCLSGEREGVRYGAEQSWNVQRLSAPSEWIPVDVDPEFLISLIDSVSRAERTQRDPVPCAV